jgi:MYXO-CTERM domain-containing protein
VKAANMVTIYNRETNLCGGLASDDGVACPAAGDYSVAEFPFTLPGDGDSYYSQYGFWGMSVGLTATFDFDGSTTECTTSVVLSKNSGYQMAMGAVAIIGLAAALGIRRRRVATIQLNEEEGTQSHFEMMPKEAGVTV